MDLPVLPTSAIKSPFLICSPSFTCIFFKCEYIEFKPSPWFNITIFPLKKVSSMVRLTSALDGEIIFVPDAAAISKP